MLYAAVVPGMGQIYNKKYWKLPLVYGGFIAIGYAINFYQEGYTKYKKELYYNLENGYTDDNDIRPGDDYTTSNYRKIVDQYKRERDFMIILMGGMYLLQIVDAHVDAHLKEFDLNPNLQVSITTNRRTKFPYRKAIRSLPDYEILINTDWHQVRPAYSLSSRFDGKLSPGFIVINKRCIFAHN